MTEEKIPLTHLSNALRNVVPDKSKVPSYRQLYAAILNGEIPADRINGRLHVNSNLKPILKYFGLVG